MKKYRSWTVDVVANGFVVNIGCQRVVAETPEKLLALTKGYLDDPEKATKELFDNSMIFDDSPTVDPTPMEQMEAMKVMLNDKLREG